MPSFASVQALREAIVSPVSQEYRDKMYHKIPDMEIVKDRAAYLLEKAKGKVILDIGCTGNISKGMKEVAKGYYGVDKSQGEWEVVDLDHRPDKLPVHEDVELIVCSEVLEHLSNPGWFLVALKKLYPEKTAIFTVPNAGSYSVRDACEIVNGDHVCWYSYQTLKVLLGRANYDIVASAWYNGPPYKAEGIIMVAQT